MPTAEKEFFLSHTFKDVSKIYGDLEHFSPIEDHFGIPWLICMNRNGNHLAVYLDCKHEQETEWSIEISAVAKISGKDGKIQSKTFKHIYKVAEGWGVAKFIKWEDMEKDYVIDDTLRVECHVRIKKMSGINEPDSPKVVPVVENPKTTGIEKKKKQNLINFDESNKEFSDVILVVENQKFYVSKLILARHSTHFKTLLLGKLEVSEVTLQNTDSAHFQYFLELLHGENPIDDDTVDGILKIADVYNSPICVKRCEQFFMEKSAKNLVSKFEISMKFKMDELKKKCIEDIKSTGDIREIVESTSENIDLETTKALLNKSINL